MRVATKWDEHMNDAISQWAVIIKVNFLKVDNYLHPFS